MKEAKLKPVFALAIFAIITACLIMPLNETRLADFLISPIGFISAIFAWFTFGMQHVQSWQRGALAGLLAAFVSVTIYVNLFLLSRVNGFPDSSFLPEMINIIFFLFFAVAALKFTIPVIAGGALAGFLSHNYTLSKESSK